MNEYFRAKEIVKNSDGSTTFINIGVEYDNWYFNIDARNSALFVCRGFGFKKTISIETGSYDGHSQKMAKLNNLGRRVRSISSSNYYYSVTCSN